MSALVKGTHHIALKCENAAQFSECVRFYSEVLGLPVERSWGEGDGAVCMIALGNARLEVFASGRISGSTGSVNHFALATDDVDACLAAAGALGYEITVPARDICLPGSPPMPARIGFCVGPVGELIEFFDEKEISA